MVELESSLNSWESVSHCGHFRLHVNQGHHILITVCVKSCVLELCCTKPEKIHMAA